MSIEALKLNLLHHCAPMVQCMLTVTECIYITRCYVRWTTKIRCQQVMAGVIKVAKSNHRLLITFGFFRTSFLFRVFYLKWSNVMLNVYKMEHKVEPCYGETRQEKKGRRRRKNLFKSIFIQWFTRELYVKATFNAKCYLFYISLTLFYSVSFSLLHTPTQKKQYIALYLYM